MENGTNASLQHRLEVSLERSEAQIASGQTVAIEPVLYRLRASIARMQAKAEQEMHGRRTA